VSQQIGQSQLPDCAAASLDRDPCDEEPCPEGLDEDCGDKVGCGPCDACLDDADVDAAFADLLSLAFFFFGPATLASHRRVLSAFEGPVMAGQRGAVLTEKEQRFVYTTRVRCLSLC